MNDTHVCISSRYPASLQRSRQRSDIEYLERTMTRRTHPVAGDPRHEERLRCASVCETIRDSFGEDEVRSRYVAGMCADVLRSGPIVGVNDW